MAARKTEVAPTAGAGAKATAKATQAMVERAATAARSGILAPYYTTLLDRVDKGLRLKPGTEYTVDPVSSGMLCIDHVLGGGVRSVFNQVSGMEQSAKTTMSISVLGGCVRANVPMIGYDDAEGSMHPDYAAKVLGGFGLQDVFNQVTRRYYSTNNLEQATLQLARFIYHMPDKLWFDAVGAWCYVFPKNQATWQPVKAALDASGLHPDKNASVGDWWVYPTPYSGAEAAFFIDSWPALIPEAIDELIEQEIDAGAGLGLVARVMADQLRMFAGRLKRKGVILWAVNQMREKPMVKYGSPEYEPCGNALKLYTMVRNTCKVRAVPEGWDKDPQASNLCIEEDVWGRGYDRYAFKHFKNIKNKMSRPFMENFFRVWTSDAVGNAQGLDPVFDTWQYLKTTEQVVGGRNQGFQIQLKEGVKGPLQQLQGMPMKWVHFKSLVLAEHQRDKDLWQWCATELNLQKPPALRATLFHQLQTDKTLWGDQYAEETAE